MSGFFFTGPPFEILSAWRDQRITLVLSPDILDEYRRVGHRLAAKHQGVDVGPLLNLVAVHSEIVVAPPLGLPVCDDPTDDKFFACAVAANCSFIISGDKHLHRASGYGGVEVLSPRIFVDQHLAQ
jgi:putative PIN family toxin of toxin-antitoxin system